MTLIRKMLVSSAFLALTACGFGPETSSLNQAESEAQPLFLDEADFEAQFVSQVLPLIEQGEWGHFQGVDDKKIVTYTLRHPAPKGKIVLVQGFTENLLKYRELITTFHRAGYSVYTYDQRGQGKSERLIRPNFALSPEKQAEEAKKAREMVWVNHWSDYVDDLNSFVRNNVPHDGLPTFIFSHSMGAAVAADYLTRDTGDIRAAVISSPILELNTGKFGGWANLLAALGSGLDLIYKTYAPTNGPVDPDGWQVETGSTSSPQRFYRYKADVMAAGEAMGGASFKWVHEVLQMNKRLAKPESPDAVRIPFILSTAGLDALANPGGQAKFCQGAGGLCEPYFALSSRHEIYNEVDSIRRPFLERVLAFYEEQR